ncbi:MAG: MFS transporter [Syntrophomonadaceae bacterium]
MGLNKGLQISNIVLLGLVSMFVDMSSEMVYPLIPLYLTSVLGATPAILGVIEGIAESLASLLKVFSGYIADQYRNKKQLTLWGYSAAVVYKVILLIAGSWSGVLAARVIDRIGKGIRTAPRDALIAESCQAENLGGSFGLHKMLDMLGSALGILIAYFLVVSNFFSFRGVFIVSIIPAVLGVMVLLLVREKKDGGSNHTKIDFNFRQLDWRFKAFLAIACIFTLGNSSNAFLLLKAQTAGYNAQTVILLYFAYNLVASILAWPSGKLSDRIGRRALLVAGYTLFGLVYIGFALSTSSAAFLLLFIVYGAYTAFTSGVERALITELAPPNLKGTLLGMHATLVGIALLPASILAGVLWDVFGAAAPFWFGGGLGLLAAAAISIVLRIEPA